MMQKPHTFSSPPGIQNEAIQYIYSEQIGTTLECRGEEEEEEALLPGISCTALGVPGCAR